jgi:hypothetical protein
VFDICALVLGGVDSTISMVIWNFSKSFAFMPYAWGALASHFFAPNFFRKIPRLRYFIWIPISIGVLVLSIIYYPARLIHPFLVFFIGIAVGLCWSQE